MSAYWIILFLILLALASPATVQQPSLPRLITAVTLSFVVVVLPLFVFFFSSFLVLDLEWKGACRHGWLDCFILGKLALTPFVLVAIAALYKTEALRVNAATKRWMTAGIFLGAIVAIVCLVFGLACIGFDKWMLVPGYVAVWYSVRAVQLVRRAPFKFQTYLTALLGTIPFWLASWWWSRSVYESLPNEAPTGCFIVTAASRGHASCVGPFVGIIHRGRKLSANQQLIAFWQFEGFWRAQSPRSHAAFRKVYNWIGPAIAVRITSPWLADAVYLALKPAEWIVRCINRETKEHYELHQMD